jgi:import inner membrane translocase subunit TIM23
MSRSITRCASHLRQRTTPTCALISSQHSRLASQLQRPTTFSLQPSSSSEPHTNGKRHASTTATSPPSPSKEVVTWQRFFELRQTRRWTNVAASGVSTVAAISVAGPIIATSELIGSLAQSAGIMDPIFAIGLPTLAMGGVGWLAGPLLGNLIFSLRVGKSSLADMATVSALWSDDQCFGRAPPRIISRVIS